MAETPDYAADAGSRIACRVSPSFTKWLAERHGVQAVTTYPSGKLAFIDWHEGQPARLMKEPDFSYWLRPDKLIPH